MPPSDDTRTGAVRIEEDLKGRLQNLARQEGKSTSDVVRSLVERYVRDCNRDAALRALWNRMQQNAEETGTAPEDVEEAIRMVRLEDRAEQSRNGAAEDRV